MVNFKLLAVKIGDELKYDTSVKQIDRIADAIFDFECLYFPQDNISSERAQLIYDWVMTLNEQEMSEKDKLTLIKEFVFELAPEDHSVRGLFDKNKEQYTQKVEKSFQTPDDHVKTHITQIFQGDIENFASGDINTYNTNIYLNALIKAIEESKEIPEEDKKSLIDKIKDIANNPYVSGISSGLIVEGIKALSMGAKPF